MLVKMRLRYLGLYPVSQTVLLVAASLCCVTSVPTGGESDYNCVKPSINGGHGSVKPLNNSQYYSGREAVTVECYDGFALTVDGKPWKRLQMFCHDYVWRTEGGLRLSEIPYIRCDAVRCGSAPVIDNAEMYANMDRDHVTYYCNYGYVLANPAHTRLECQDGDWTGIRPSCVLSCSTPGGISNGKFIGYTRDGEWLEGTSYNTQRKYLNGYYVKYSCNNGYRLTGNSKITCGNAAWLGLPPKCVLKQVVTCSALSDIQNGQCVCGTINYTTQCECVCDNGYKLVGNSMLTCHYTGDWNYDMPTCIEGQAIDTSSQSSKESPSHTHLSTLAIVVATACSVLGILLLIMVIMIFRRRKPRPPSRLCRPSSTPPPYSRVHNNSVDELDRYLLIGYENPNETLRANLPSYEEAMAAGQNPIGNRGDNLSRSDDGQGQVGEYRPLPSIPGSFRANQMISGENSSRHSIITTSTMNRDGVSELFGSIDTVNVSVSDASTAVTIETLDSATSHHSNMSRRATAGSIASANSNESLVTEDVPLLDSIQREENDKSDEDGGGSERDE